MMPNSFHAKRVHPLYPIFLIPSQHYNILYSAGHLAVVDKPDSKLVEKHWKSNYPDLIEETGLTHVSDWLIRRACNAINERRHLFTNPFEPECLMVYLSRYCNLGCSYCYVKDRQICYFLKKRLSAFLKLPSPVINTDSFRSAAKLVAVNCAKKQQPFHLVLHGGGEPTLHWELIKKMVSISRETAEQFGIGWFGYIATNGVISTKNAEWLASNFNRIGLSCDGPPDIQNQQRPLFNGKKTSRFVQRTAAVIAESGGEFEIRTTITPRTVTRQEEIISYFCHMTGADSIRFEPVYLVHGHHHENIETFLPEHAELFAEHFLAAQKLAFSSGIRLSLSGIRLDEIHGPHCNVLKNVLHLTPDGTASSCFFCTDTQQTGNEFYNIGYQDHKTGLFMFNCEKIACHIKASEIMAAECHNCINYFHCSGQCPEQCRAIEHFNVKHKNIQKDHEFKESFRCLLYQKLAVAWITDSAQKLVEHENLKDNISSSVLPTDNKELFLSWLKSLPTKIDQRPILNQWNAVKGIYDFSRQQMPSPGWKQKGFDQTGAEAWRHLCQVIPQIPAERSISIYIHVPFCQHLCGFCDCHRIPLGKKSEKKQRKYFRALISEMNMWSAIPGLAQRKITTIHFGGGTPGCLNTSIFEDIIGQIRKKFQITPKTEWAIESTARLITDHHLTNLCRWGFTRIHIGVQTLRDSLRFKTGRQLSSEQLLKRLASCMHKGFITSVDVIYGLPGQTFNDLGFTLEKLINQKIHGISLYRFNISRRNRWFVKTFENFSRNHLCDYLLLQMGDQMLDRSGYRKNHFNHYAGPVDTNLYFTYPQRSEDLLAMGPTADGIFSGYRYRHPGFASYCSKLTPDFPALEGGVGQTPFEYQWQPLMESLINGNIQASLLHKYPFSAINQLLEKWLNCEFIRYSGNFNGFELTANGSWFLTDMIHELKVHFNNIHALPATTKNTRIQ